MSPDLARRSAARSDPADHEQPAAAVLAIDWCALRNTSRACCCPAEPAVVAVMPPAAGRDHPTDLLLCAHHYRASRVALRRAGADVFDSTGRRVTPPASDVLGLR